MFGNCVAVSDVDVRDQSPHLDARVEQARRLGERSAKLGAYGDARDVFARDALVVFVREEHARVPARGEV